MARKKLILLASDRMDSNKKPDRNEDNLIRMSAAARKFMNFSDKAVEIYPTNITAANRGIRSQVLNIFHAFKPDVTDLKRMMRNGELTPEEAVRVGFVTTRTFNKINGTNKKPKLNKNVWIADELSETVIGSDPEFLLFDNDENRVVRANSILSHSGKVASDGAMAELRPDPSVLPEEHVKNIVKLLRSDKAIKEIRPYRWMAACYHRDEIRDYPVGGHIHIGMPARIASLDRKTKEAFFIVMNKILDELLAIPLIKLDGAEHGRRRRTNCKICTTGHHGYGFFGEMRIPNGRLEHRTLSGMWLMHPSVAKAVFGTARAIIDEIFKLVSSRNFSSKYMCLYAKDDESGNDRIIKHMYKRDFNGWKNVPLAKDIGCTTSSDKMIEILNNSNTSYVNSSYLKKWFSRLKSFSTYKDNSKYIRGLYEILKISAKDLNSYDKEMKKNWLDKKKFMVDL